MYTIVITNRAENDLVEIARYIAKELFEPATAQDLVSKLAGSIKSLETWPYRYELVKDTRLAQLGIRHLKFENYAVFYIVSEQVKTITIVRILNNKRNWQDLL